MAKKVFEFLIPVETCVGADEPSFSPMPQIVDLPYGNGPRLTAFDKGLAELLKSATVGELLPLCSAAPPDLVVLATTGGERLRLRYAPQPGMTGQEAGWAAQLAVFAANPYVDWGDWIAKRGMLRHFEVVG